MANNKVRFTAYIDESGDEGFTIKNGKWVSSRWFITGALIIPKAKDLALSKVVNLAKEKFDNFPTNKPLHFTTLNHDRKKFLIRKIVEEKSFRCAYVAFDKKPTPQGSMLREKGYLYNYCIRFLLERISWLVGDYNGVVDLIFENRSNTKYDELEKYITDVISDPRNQIRKNVISSFTTLTKAQSKNLQLADAVTSSLYKGLEYNGLGDIEPSYISMLKDYIYNSGGNYSSYGLKFFKNSIISKEMLDEYRWLNDFTNIRSQAT